VDPVSHLSTPMGCRNPLSHNADYCHCEFRRGCTQRRDPISGAAVSACKCGCDDRRAQSAPASDPRRSGTEGGTGPRRALYSPVSSRRSGLTRRGSRARSPNANSNHRREHTALRFRNQSLECRENCETCSLWYLTMPSSSLVVVEDSIEQRISARNMLFRNP